MIAMGMLNDQLMVKWTGASGPVAVKTAMIGLKLAVIKAPVMPKKKQAVVNHMIPKGSAGQQHRPDDRARITAPQAREGDRRNRLEEASTPGDVDCRIHACPFSLGG